MKCKKNGNGNWSSLSTREIIGLLVLNVLLTSSSCRDQSRTRIALSDQRDPIPILTKPDPEMFPDSWLVAPYSARAEALASRERDRSVVAVRNAISKYPNSILRKNLDCVYIIGELRFSDISAAGTNSRDRIYVCAQGEADGFTDEFIESTFHHEFSSILLRNYAVHFPEGEWFAANPEDFQYRESGTDAIKAGKDSEDYDEELSKKGFFSEYAMWAFEDDFNTIVTALFSGDKMLWQEVGRDSPIDTKVTIAINFFHRLDERFDREFFRSLITHPRRSK